MSSMSFSEVSKQAEEQEKLIQINREKKQEDKKKDGWIDK